jgi:hypothetical protein
MRTVGKIKNFKNQKNQEIGFGTEITQVRIGACKPIANLHGCIDR